MILEHQFNVFHLRQFKSKEWDYIYSILFKNFISFILQLFRYYFEDINPLDASSMI